MVRIIFFVFLNILYYDVWRGGMHGAGHFNCSSGPPYCVPYAWILLVLPLLSSTTKKTTPLREEELEETMDCHVQQLSLHLLVKLCHFFFS